MDPAQGFAGRDLLSPLHLPPMVMLQIAASFALLSVVDFSSANKLNCPRQTHKASLLKVKRDLRCLFTPHSWHSVWLHIPTQITASSLCLSAEQELGNALAHTSVLPPNPTSCKVWLTQAPSCCYHTELGAKPELLQLPAVTISFWPCRQKEMLTSLSKFLIYARKWMGSFGTRSP